MRNTWWKSGQYNALCDVCGYKFKSVDLQQRWDGLMVCKADWETRHPQELIRPIKDQNKLPWTRPEPNDQFVSVNYILVPQALVAIPSIVITASSLTQLNLATIQGTLPVGQHIVNVVIESQVSLIGITTGSGWAAGTVFNIINNSLTAFPVTDPTGTYTINYSGIGFTTYTITLTGPLGATSVLTAAIAQLPSANPAVIAHTYQVNCTGTITSLDFSGFPGGCIFNLSTQGTHSTFAIDDPTLVTLIDTMSSITVISGYDLLFFGINNSGTIDNSGQLHIG